jgi:hypothetical protein
MASEFDVIYEIDGTDESVTTAETTYVANVPDPVVIRGAGNITV